MRWAIQTSILKTNWGFSNMARGFSNTAGGHALCRDATLVPCRARRQRGPGRRRGTEICSKQRAVGSARYLACGGPHRLCVPAADVGGRWNDHSTCLLRRLAHLRSECAPPSLGAVAAQAWVHRWWGALAIVVQRAVCRAALDNWTLPALLAADAALPLADVLALAEAEGPVVACPCAECVGGCHHDM